MKRLLLAAAMLATGNATAESSENCVNAASKEVPSAVCEAYVKRTERAVFRFEEFMQKPEFIQIIEEGDLDRLAQVLPLFREHKLSQFTDYNPLPLVREESILVGCSRTLDSLTFTLPENCEGRARGNSFVLNYKGKRVAFSNRHVFDLIENETEVVSDSELDIAFVDIEEFQRLTSIEIELPIEPDISNLPWKEGAQKLSQYTKDLSLYSKNSRRSKFAMPAFDLPEGPALEEIEYQWDETITNADVIGQVVTVVGNDADSYVDLANGKKIKYAVALPLTPKFAELIQHKDDEQILIDDADLFVLLPDRGQQELKNMPGMSGSPVFLGDQLVGTINAANLESIEIEGKRYNAYTFIGPDRINDFLENNLVQK